MFKPSGSSTCKALLRFLDLPKPPAFGDFSLSTCQFQRLLDAVTLAAGKEGEQHLLLWSGRSGAAC